MAVFQAVAETGSFRKAAKKLSLSPSVVSHHVTQLEAHLGLALLYRSTRKVSLTDAGAEFLRSTQDMTSAAERGLAAMQMRSDQPVGRLKITAGTAMAYSPYIEAFIEFSRAYAGVALSVNFTMEKVDLEGSDYDIALRGTPFGLSDSSYKAKKLVDMHSAFVATPAYVNARPAPKTIEEVLGWDRIMFPPTPMAAIYAFTGMDRSVQIPPARFECDSPEAARKFALAGLGFAMLDYNVVRDDLEAGRLVRVLPEAQLPVVTFWAMWPGNAGSDSLAHRFVEFIAPRWAKLEV